MKGTYHQLKLALRPLGDVKEEYNELKYNCPRCAKMGAPPDKYNLQVRFNINGFHCWACNYKGSLHRLIEDYGYKDFLHLFEASREDVLNKTTKKKRRKRIELPEYCISALNNTEAREYLYSRKITKEQIIQRQIKYCYSGEHKGCIVFPSYNFENMLTHFVVHNFKAKSYKAYKGEGFVAFYETFIDKRSPVILTEGVYDSLVLPNAIPLLGLTISEELLLFLSGTTVLLITDSVVNPSQVAQLLKQLNKVCDANSVVLKNYKDPNEAAQADDKVLVEMLKTYY